MQVLYVCTWSVIETQSVSRNGKFWEVVKLWSWMANKLFKGALQCDGWVQHTGGTAECQVYERRRKRKIPVDVTPSCGERRNCFTVTFLNYQLSQPEDTDWCYHWERFCNFIHEILMFWVTETNDLLTDWISGFNWSTFCGVIMTPAVKYYFISWWHIFRTCCIFRQADTGKYFSL